MNLKLMLASASLVVTSLASAGIEISPPLVQVHRHGWHGMITEASTDPPALARDAGEM